MKCKRAKSSIALFVGDDLDTASKKELKAHLSACPPCRDYWQDMKSSMQVLRDPAGETSEPPRDSVWPRVASRLPRRAPRQSHAPFKGWIAASSVVAACCVLVAYGITYQSPNSSQSFAVPGQMFGLPGDSETGLQRSAGARALEPRSNPFDEESDNTRAGELRWHRELDTRRTR